jgi:Rne/Rng family ribonuclease
MRFGEHEDVIEVNGASQQPGVNSDTFRSDNAFALIVAAASYEDPGLARLRAPARDSDRLATLLADQSIGGYQVQTVVDERTHLVAEEVEGFFNDRKAGDIAVLYLSCHGVKDLDGRLRFASTNTKLNRLVATTIGADFIYDLVDRCRAQNVLVLLDCCYSGAYLKGHHPRAPGRAGIDGVRGRGRAVITSCTSLEYSFEVDTGAVEGTPVASVFTDAIIDGLSTGQADVDGDGWVSVDDLYDYVFTRVRQATPHQTPEKKWGDIRGDFFIARSPRRPSVLRQVKSRVISESDFPVAPLDAVKRVMLVRQQGDRTQLALLEDGILIEYYDDNSSHQLYVGNVHLGKVRSVLPSMEAAFIDIGDGRNGVLYAGDINFDATASEGKSKRVESLLTPGQSVLVQVTRDPAGHKGARLTTQVSLPGRYVIYVPGASMTGISRKLPDAERKRLTEILKKVMPENAGVIVRAVAEGAGQEELSLDVARLAAQWEAIERQAVTASAPALLYSEPDLTIRMIRDVHNEDFSNLVVAGDEEWDVVDEYIRHVAPHLANRLTRWQDERDVFAAYRIGEQLAEALERRVRLPSGGSLVIDKTEAMTVIDVNAGKFTGQGGSLEETVTRSNLEAAEEIARQLRLRDVGGIIVVDFIDMVLEGNRELVLERLVERLARDRTRRRLEVTSFGLVNIARNRIGPHN